MVDRSNGHLVSQKSGDGGNEGRSLLLQFLYKWIRNVYFSCQEDHELTLRGDSQQIIVRGIENQQAPQFLLEAGRPTFLF
jgi:hypothetical protein